MLDLAFSVDGNEDVFGFVTVFGTPFDVAERDALTRGVHRVGELLFFNVVDTNFTIVTCFFISFNYLFIYLEILNFLFEIFWGGVKKGKITCCDIFIVPIEFCAVDFAVRLTKNTFTVDGD